MLKDGYQVSNGLAKDADGRLLVRESGGSAGLKEGRKAVAVAGTEEPLVGQATPCSWVLVTAFETNTQKVVVGGPGVIAALAQRQGVPLSAGDSVPLPVDDVADVYVDSLVNGEGVIFAYGEL